MQIADKNNNLSLSLNFFQKTTHFERWLAQTSTPTTGNKHRLNKSLLILMKLIVWGSSFEQTMLPGHEDVLPILCTKPFDNRI